MLQSEDIEVGKRRIQEIIEIDPCGCDCILLVVHEPDLLGYTSSSSSRRRGRSRSFGVPCHFLFLPSLSLHSVHEF